ncbi:hypothetical protein [Chryseobacterium sp. AG844]|uniref:hypothetical protein n=1 Tax=Chryseobacterium sp. AG844 TaxID=2183998 RepID=UPI0015E82DD3|nr:hypothetical protein [Chryseobacterium sp. AG844]
MRTFYKPISKLLPIVDGESFSITVLVFHKNLENFDLGYYDFEVCQWVVFKKR